MGAVYTFFPSPCLSLIEWIVINNSSLSYSFYASLEENNKHGLVNRMSKAVTVIPLS